MSQELYKAAAAQAQAAKGQAGGQPGGAPSGEPQGEAKSKKDDGVIDAEVVDEKK